MNNTEYYLLENEVATAPRNQAGTGTIETNKLGLIGTGTAFLTELATGAWILDLPNNEMRRVVFVESDTYAILDRPFTTDLPALTALDMISHLKNNAKEISVLIPDKQQDNTTANDWGKVDGVDFPPGTGNTYTKSSRSRSGATDMVNPLILDATGTQMAVNITY